MQSKPVEGRMETSRANHWIVRPLILLGMALLLALLGEASLRLGAMVRGRDKDSISVASKPVDSFAVYSGVSNTCFYSPDLTSKLTNPSLSSSAGPSQLVDHDIDTNVTGKFSFFLQCASTADSSTYINSNRAQLEIINNPNLEEI
jgi:hypothetical protein